MHNSHATHPPVGASIGTAGILPDGALPTAALPPWCRRRPPAGASGAPPSSHPPLPGHPPRRDHEKCFIFLDIPSGLPCYSGAAWPRGGHSLGALPPCLCSYACPADSLVTSACLGPWLSWIFPLFRRGHPVGQRRTTLTHTILTVNGCPDVPSPLANLGLRRGKLHFSVVRMRGSVSMSSRHGGPTTRLRSHKGALSRTVSSGSLLLPPPLVACASPT